MRITIANINAAVKAAGMDLTLYRGAGYFYFEGPDLYLLGGRESGVYVFHLTSLSIEEWVEEARQRVREEN